MSIRADEDRVVARRGPGLDAPPDLGRDPVGLLRARCEDLEADRGRRRGGPLRSEPLDDARPDFEPVGVVEPDEPVGGVQDRRERPIVAAQDDGPRPQVAVAELEDVVHRRTAERVDRLVVVADDRDVAMALCEDGDQFGLRPVRVLELVDEDVAEPPRDGRSRCRRRANQAQRECDLVAEVDAAAGREKALVRRVGAGQLRLAGGFLRRAVGSGRERPIRGTFGGLGQRSGLRGDPVGMGRVVGRRDVLVLAAAEQRGERREEARRIAERAIASRSNSKRCSRRKMTTSGRDRTRRSVGRPSSSAYSRISPSPNAWNVEMAVSM